MLDGLLQRLKGRDRDEDLNEHVESPGEIILDPAYNERYEGERELQRLSKLEESPQYDDSSTHNQPTSGSYNRY